MPNIVREDHDSLNATFTVQLPLEEYEPDFKKQLNKYRNQAHLKGFRKGKTPLSVVRKMFGRRILVELVNEKVGKGLIDYLEEQNIKYLGGPIPAKEQINYEFDPKDLQDFEFKYDLGLVPQFEVEGLEDISLTRYDVTIPDSLIEERLMDMRMRQSGEQAEVEDEIQDLDIIKLAAKELEGETIKEDGWTNDFSIIFSELSDEAKELFKEKKKGDTLRFDIFNLGKNTDEAFVRKYFLDINEDADESPEVGNMFEATIVEVKRKMPAELTQEFFDSLFGGDTGVASEEEAKEKIKDSIKSYYDSQSDQLLQNELQRILDEQNELTLPETFLKRWMVTSGSLPKDKTPEEAIGDAVKGINQSLVRDKLADQFEITVSEDDVKNAMRGQLFSYFGGQDLGNIMDEYVERMLENKEQYMIVHGQVLAQRLFETMKEKVNIVETEVSMDEFSDIVKAENEKHQPTKPEEQTIEDAEIIAEEVGNEEVVNED